MSKFNLGYLKPDKTVWHTLTHVHIPPSNPEPVRLELRSSGRINAEYTSAMLKLNRDRELEQLPGSIGEIEAGDARQLKLFAKHVVIGWDNVCDEAMQPMSFSAKDAETLLLAISIEHKRPDLVAPAMARAADPNNFSDPVGSAEALGKP